MNFNGDHRDIENKKIRFLNWKVDDNKVVSPTKSMGGKTLSRTPEDPLFKAMKPLIMCYRIMGRFPFTCTPEGKLRVSILSKWGVYWGLVYAGQTWFTILAIRDYLDDFNSVSFFDLIRSSLNISMLLIQICSIIPIVFEAKLTSAYFNDWCDFQIEYESVIGMPFAPRSARALRIAVTFAPFLVAGVVYLQRGILFKKNWFTLIPYFNIFFVCHLHIFFWTFTLFEVRWAALSLRKHGAMLLLKHCSADEISRLRKLWLKLSNLAQHTGTAFALSMIIMTVLNGFSFVTASFALLTSLCNKNSTLGEWLLVVVITGTMMIIICESGHRTTEQVGNKMAETLLTYDVPGKFTVSREVDVFIQAIKSNFPVVSFAGFFIINRTTITSNIAAIVTYLIVLVQFQISS